MIAEKVSCQRCKNLFVSLEHHQEILKIAEDKGLGSYRAYFSLCQNCRAQAFAEQMIGNHLEKVKRTEHVAKRRQRLGKIPDLGRPFIRRSVSFVTKGVMHSSM